MLRRLSAGLLATAAFIGAPLAATAQEGSADDLGVMSISLADVVKPTIGFQGALQGAGTPNQTGIGVFLPLKVNDQSVWFVDALVNVDHSDRGNYSSLINTTVAGTTVSTSTRVGYRWMDFDRTWMFGVNAGYDSRPLNTGSDDTGVPLFGTEQDVFFQQVAAGLEARSDKFGVNLYTLYPVGTTESVLNWYYSGGALKTYGADFLYYLNENTSASLGYYHQSGDDLTAADGSGINAELEVGLFEGLTLGILYSYDEAFDDRISANLTYRYGGQYSKSGGSKSLISSLSGPVKHRNVRVHDCGHWYDLGCQIDNEYHKAKDWVQAGAVGMAIDLFNKAWDRYSKWNDAVAEAVEQNVESEGLESFLESEAGEDALSFCTAVGTSMCGTVLELTTDVGGLADDIADDVSRGTIASITDAAADLSASFASTVVLSDAVGVEEETGFVQALLDSLTEFLGALE